MVVIGIILLLPLFFQLADVKAAEEAEAQRVADAKTAEGSSQVTTVVSPKMGTLIDGKVNVIKKEVLPSGIRKSFQDGIYTTVETNEDIVVYRTFGGKADAGGGFATTQGVANRMQAKVDAALLPEWGNSRAYEAAIVIPKGTIINIGKVAEQTTQSGALLKGGADQILLPQNWPLDWIQEIRGVASK
jgi:hypothetical protein